MSDGLSPALLALLDERVNSFDKLELVIALHRAPEMRASVRDLAAVLDLDRDEIRIAAGELAAARVVAINAAEEVRLVMSTADELVIRELVAVYQTEKVALVQTIASSAMHRLRNLAGRAFADAFVIRKKPGGDGDDR